MQVLDLTRSNALVRQSQRGRYQDALKVWTASQPVLSHVASCKLRLEGPSRGAWAGCRAAENSENGSSADTPQLDASGGNGAAGGLPGKPTAADDGRCGGGNAVKSGKQTHDP